MIYSTEILNLAMDIERMEARILEAKKRIAVLTRMQAENKESLAEGKSGWNDGAYIARYINRHIPTGKEFPAEKEFTSRDAFLAEMASWNRMYPTTYAYREV